jgi:putative transposase
MVNRDMHRTAVHLDSLADMCLDAGVEFFDESTARNELVRGATNAAWCAQIARNLSEAREDRVNPIKYLVHDRDKRFCAVFDHVFCAEGIGILRTPWRAPRANAYAERFIRTVRTECLDRLFIVNEVHLASVLETYVEHYNTERPHRGRGLVPPAGEKMVTPLTAFDSVKRRDRLGGLLHEYHRTAA